MTHPSSSFILHPSSLIAEVWRGDVRESLHAGLFVETDDAGGIAAAGGDPEFVTALRSAAKPLQAVPLTVLPAAAGLGLTDEELAICCASHPGQPRHTALVASVLALSGLLPDRLVCAPAGEPPSPLKHGCSGNHAALALAAHLLGAPPEDYYRLDHPAQQLVQRTLGEMAGTEEVRLATDGCGIPTFGLRLREMACVFAALTRPGAPWERIPRVMGTHPELIGADEWIDVRLIHVTTGRVIAKTGAEGLLCLGLPGRARGMAVKIADGSTRALGVVALAALEQAGWITPEEAAHPLLADLRRPRFFGPDGNALGEIRLR